MREEFEMTHSLHRFGSVESLEKDYVFLMISAGGYNVDGGKDKFKKFFEIVMKHNPVNAGNGKVGNLYANKQLELDNLVDRTCAHAAFRDKTVVVKVMRKLKEANLGLSVVVSGLFEHVNECCQKVGLTRHTIEYSLGRWGKTELLPSEDLLAIQSMCGHALISVNLIEEMVSEIRSGKVTPQQASEILAKPCVCGIFNTERAAEILSQLASD